MKKLLPSLLLALALLFAGVADSSAFLRGGMGGASGGGGVSYLPTVGSAPQAVYSPYKVVSTYGGPLFQLTRVADSATLDVMPTITGAPDVLSITTFLSGATYAAVSKIYDQSGNGNDTASGQKLWCFNAINGIYSITHDSNLPAGNLKFSLPNSLTGTLNSVTLVAVQSYATTNSAGAGLLGPTYNTANTIGLRAAQTYKNQIAANAGGSFRGDLVTAGRGRSQPQVTVMSSGASSLVLYLDGVSSSFTAAGSNSWSGGTIGYVDGTSNLGGENYFYAVYPTGLSSGDVATLRSYLNIRFGVVTSSDTQIVWPGNSIVQGQGATFMHNNQWYMQQALSKSVFISNQAISGTTAQQMYANTSFYTAEYRSDLTHNVMVTPEGTNDLDFRASGSIVGYGTTVYNSYIIPFVQAAKTAGFDRVVVPTMLPRNWTGTSTDISQKATEQQAYNTLVINNAATYGYTMWTMPAFPTPQTPATLPITPMASTRLQRFMLIWATCWRVS